jgi:DNA-binding transcriptional LysR family regulator
MIPTIRQLQAFAYIYKLGSLTQASKAMHLTQSALSLLLQQLEENLGVTLFERTSRSLRPTAIAHETFEMASNILDNVNNLVNNTRGIAEKRHGVLHFGVATAVAATILPEAIARFEKQYPDIKLVIHDTGPEQIISPIQERKVEFSIGTTSSGASDVVFETLLTDHLSAIYLQDSSIPQKKITDWRSLSDLPIISVRSGNEIRTLIDTAMVKAGIDFKPKWEVSYLSTALALTLKGLGVAVLPAYLIESFHHSNLVIKSIQDPLVERNVYLIRPKGVALTSAAQALIDILKSVANTVSLKQHKSYR